MYQSPQYQNSLFQTEHQSSSSYPLQQNLNTNPPLTQPNLNFLSDIQTTSTLDEAFLLIRNEINKRDVMIKELQTELASLKSQLQLQSNPSPLQHQYATFSQNPSNRIDSQYLTANAPFIPSTKESPLIINDITNNKRNLSKTGYHSDTEKKLRVMTRPKMATTPNCGGADGMGVASQSRVEVKNFLKEVKETVDPQVFKEFIKYIKVLTSKSEVVNKKVMIEKVKLLFGTEHAYLYSKFEEILCVKKMVS
jgi:hypothetical protein